MKKCLYTILTTLLMLLCIAASAQQYVDKHLASVFWKIKARGSDQVSYLIGTCHVFGKSWVDARPDLYRYISECSTFICETSSRNAQESILDSITKNRKIRSPYELFGDDTTLVNNYFAKLGWNEKPSDMLRRAMSEKEQVNLIIRMASVLEYQLIREVGVGKEGTRIDAALINVAITGKKELIGLDDTMGFLKMNLINGPNSYCGKVVDVINWMDDPDISMNERQLKAAHLAYIKLYKSGLMEFETYRIRRGNTDFQNVIGRNHLWIGKLLPLLRQGPCFISVGAGHLFAGEEEGIVELLRKNGYKVTPMKLPAIKSTVVD
jgi:uncharacterized protein YbaP (TraB family)